MSLVAPTADFQFPLMRQSGSVSRGVDKKDDPRQRLLAGTTQDLSVLALTPTRRKLSELRTWPENWDGFGSVRPIPAAVDRTETVLSELYRVVSQMGLDWLNPYIAANEVGHITLEWWHGDRKLTIYVGPTSAHYLRVWGPNTATEIEDGELSIATLGTLWQWLNA